MLGCMHANHNQVKKAVRMEIERSGSYLVSDSRVELHRILCVLGDVKKKPTIITGRGERQYRTYTLNHCRARFDLWPHGFVDRLNFGDDRSPHEQDRVQ